MSQRQDLDLVIAREGRGRARFRRGRDCVSLVCSVIRSQGGAGLLSWPTWCRGLSESEAVVEACRRHGSVWSAWESMLVREGSLVRSGRENHHPGPGAICVMRDPDGVSVVDLSCRLWCRTPTGLSRPEGTVQSRWSVRGAH